MKLLEEYQRLINVMPHPRSEFGFSQAYNSTNFGDYIFRSTNIYWGFDSAQSNNCCYLFDSALDKDCIDCSRCVKCEGCYECVDCYKSYEAFFCDDCDRCIECYFCSRCKNCKNCFGCVFLENKQYCIFNKQYSKEEYERNVKELLKKQPEENSKRLADLSLNYPFYYIRQSIGSSNVNTPYGSYIYKSINSYYCFDSSNLIDCGYIYDSDFLENCWDCCGRSYKCVDCYECIDIADSNNCFYCDNIVKSVNLFLCYWCLNCQDCLGCVNMQDKQYCVLNRQLDKERYKKVRNLIDNDINADLSEYLK